MHVEDTFNRRGFVDSNHPAGHWCAMLSADHLLPTHKGVSEVCCNASSQVIQLVSAVVDVAYDRFFIYGWKLLQGRHAHQFAIGWTIEQMLFDGVADRQVHSTVQIHRFAFCAVNVDSRSEEQGVKCLGGRCTATACGCGGKAASVCAPRERGLQAARLSSLVTAGMIVCNACMCQNVKQSCTLLGR